MTDGQIILINVKIENKSFSWSDIGIFLLGPFAFFMHPMGWVFIPLAPVIIPVQWILWLIDLIIPTKYYNKTPVLVF